MGTVIQTQEEIEKLMKVTTTDLGLLLDTGHLLFSGGEPLTVYKKYSNRVIHIHCKDIRQDVLIQALNEDSSFLDSVLNGVFTVPGDGCIDFQNLFNQISETNYEGWVVVEAEQDPEIANPLKYATLGYNNIKEYCSVSEVRIK
jgi:inosose dehydratase